MKVTVEASRWRRRRFLAAQSTNDSVNLSIENALPYGTDAWVWFPNAAVTESFAATLESRFEKWALGGSGAAELMITA